MTIGADRPPYGTRHRKFWPFSAHLSTSPVSRDTPLRSGPRISGQSPSATPPRAGGACAAVSAALTANAISTSVFFTIVIVSSGQPLKGCATSQDLHRDDKQA